MLYKLKKRHSSFAAINIIYIFVIISMFEQPMISKIKKLIALSGIMLGSVSAFGVASYPGTVRYRQPDGSTIDVRIYGDHRYNWYTDLDSNFLMPLENGSLVKADSSFARQLEKKKTQRRVSASPYTKFPTLGRQKALIILVEFSDKSFRYGIEDFKDMICSPGYSLSGAAGSATDYFVENSAGRFMPEFEIYGPVKLTKPMSYYGANNDDKAYIMVEEACKALDSEIDFSQYDRDKDGWADNVYIFYAGYGEADGGGANSIWPHSANLYHKGINLNLDGVAIGSYSCSNELIGGTTRLVGIGTFCHEFSHVLGLPDVYSTNDNSAFTPYYYSLMDHGNYNGDGRVPCALTAYERYFLGWGEPIALDSNGTVRVPPVASNIAYRMNLAGYDEQYYLFENRTKQGWDSALPGEGLLIWHIDYSRDVWDRNGVNNDETRQRIDLIEADGTATMNSSAGDPFPGTSNVTSFANFTDHTGKIYSSRVENIRKSGNDLLFDFNSSSAMPASVSGVKAGKIEDDNFILSWDKAAVADKYYVSVSAFKEGRETPLEAYTALPVETTSLYVSGLEPSTEYHCTVSAIQGITLSAATKPLGITTDEAGIAYFAPVALEASEITDTGFTARWQPLDKASEYLIDLFTIAEEAVDRDIAAFTSPLSVPANWNTTVTGTMSVSGYYGEAAPSLRFSQNAEMIETPVYDTDITSVSFWMRGYKAAAEASLTLSVMTDGKWSDVMQISPINNTAGEIKTWTAPKSDKGVKAARLTYMGPSGSSVCVDDLTISFGLASVRKKVLDAHNVGDATSYNIASLEPGREYSYIISGTDGKRLSLPSEEIKVKTTSGGTSGVSLINCTEEGEKSEARVFNISGIDVKASTTLPAGIYIIKKGNKTEKVIVK